jgi:hypothetical protein
MKLKNLITFTILTIILALNVSANSCAISQGIGAPLLADTDCDRIPDAQDNCAFLPNPGQFDIDNNFRGDACDLLIESIGTSPSNSVYSSRSFETIVTILNNREHPLRNIRMRLIIPQLGIETVEYLDNIKVHQSHSFKFNSRIPPCSKEGEYAIVTEASFMNPIGEWETIPGITSIRVLEGKECLKPNAMQGMSEINVLEFQDVYKGGEAVFPIKITNVESNSKDYTFSITGLDGWATYRFDPSSLVVVESGKEKVFDIYISPEEDIPPGERSFIVTVQTKEDLQRFLLVANVKENPARSAHFFLWESSIRLMIIAGLIILVVLAVVLAVLKLSENKEPQYN